jgi:3-hydroxymyristoyl/3-hydroxydecanoyl-(acyl carrier protein) dehydratase
VPILPGVAEIHDFVLPGITAVFPDLTALRRIERLKFHRPIGPGDEIELVIEREHGSTSAVRFEITRAGERCASGVLVFANDTSAALP